jgi:phage anti-repressor protein
MTQTALVPVFTGTLNRQTIQLVNARHLHAFMQVGRIFATWIKERISEYGFIEGEDYIKLDFSKLENQKTRGGNRRSIDYHITLDMAKELSMVERNEQGKQARRYFIECERKLMVKPVGSALPSARDELPAALRSAINRRAWTLSHAAYEEYRKRMAEDFMIKGGHQNPEDWKPVETRQDVLEHIEVIAGLADAYANTIRQRGRRLATMVGDDYDQAVRKLRPSKSRN